MPVPRSHNAPVDGDEPVRHRATNDADSGWLTGEPRPWHRAAAGAAGSVRRSYTFLPEAELREAADPKASQTGLDGAVAEPTIGDMRPLSRKLRPLAAPWGASRLLPMAIYQFCDTATAIGVLFAVLLARNIARMPGLNDFLAVRLSLKNILLLGFFTGAWRIICRICGLYRTTDSAPSERKRVIAAGALMAPIAGVISMTSVSGAFDLPALALFVASLIGALLLVRAGLRLVEQSRSRPRRNVLVVGSGPRARAIAQQLSTNPDQSIQIVGYVDFQPPSEAQPAGEPPVLDFDQLEATLMHAAIDEVVVGLPLRSQYLTVERVVATCERIGVPVTLPADTFRSGRAQPRPRDSGGLLAVTFIEATRDYRHWIKRGIDVLGAAGGLVLTSPLLVLIAIAIKLTSRGPVLYAQERYGFNRHRFRMYKFRTMVAGAEGMIDELEALNEAPGPLFKIRDDPRITPVGKLLRRSSMDELPQLLNVLRGEMSLVGPRPMSIRDVYKFTEASLMRRFSVMPGMTGLWQVSGRNGLQYDEWARADMSYVDTWSLWLDLRILARTIPAVLRGTGAE